MSLQTPKTALDDFEVCDKDLFSKINSLEHILATMLVSLGDQFLKTIDNIFFYINKKNIMVVRISINFILSIVCEALIELLW